MKFAFIIQARLGSSRLPKKMILPFYNGWSILDIILEKIKLNFPDDLVILATSVNASLILLYPSSLLEILENLLYSFWNISSTEPRAPERFFSMMTSTVLLGMPPSSSSLW